MPLRQARRPGKARFTLFMLALACGASAGCETQLGNARVVGSFHITGNGMYEAFQRWRATASPDDQAAINELAARKDLLIHIILKVDFLSDMQSRGAASALASSSFATNACIWHPKVDGVSPQQDWDVIYDPRRAEDFEKQYGIPTSPEVGMQHEILGHVLVVSRDPSLARVFENDEQLKEANERYALDVENRYRKRLGVPEVPPALVGAATP